jgi:hypothetical protein
MKHIYQIANIPLHWHVQTQMHEPGTSMRGSSLELFNSPGYILPESQWLHDQQEVELEGALLGTSRYRADEMLQNLRRLVGRPVDIIAYDFLDPKKSYGCGCLCPSDTELVWLHNYGVISEASIRQRDPSDIADLTISLEFQGFWEPINPYLWYFESEPEDVFSPRVLDFSSGYEQHTDYYPTPGQIWKRCADCQMWVRKNLSDREFLYSPESWSGYFSKNWGLGIGKVDQPMGWYSYANDMKLWGAPPRVMLSFEGMSLEFPEVRINATSEDVWGTRDFDTVVDLNQLDSDLDDAGYTGLEAGDQLLIGSFMNTPGYVVRAGERLDFTPVVQYEGWYPGFLLPGRSKFFVYPSNTGTFSYQIINRRL